LETCAAIPTNVSAVITACGPQAKVTENLTVSVNGFETAKFANCYHKNNLVNLKGFHHTYQDGEWKRIEETIAPIEEGFINQFTYNADNSLQTFLPIDAPNVNIMDQVSVLADIMAVISEHERDAATGRSHASSALIPIHEKENYSLLQTIATWIKYLGGISFATAGIFIVFRFLGGQSILH
jgi:hypothetical protein